ncbi:hypothetical protein LOTGIDRAFT_236306 [Lottia gigantea]|uniref:MARVEL domain-containing protein n=1 Tax=Lottia gigantea TaxID=225164 RepID=V3ZPF0_LOTGI|nr:hypothetical protein LOTGIDRAFT_236306 [Lottia gigantea]ESO84340.1 hypothetical protein LOTGIDRAFT_236306 [Lottia gigantea]
MWHYFFSHFVYHLIRWFPKHAANRIIILVLLMVIMLGLLVAQIYVLTLDHSKRWCAQPLFDFLIVSIIETLFMIGFSFLFMIMSPVPDLVKKVYHVFGFINLVIGLASVIITSNSGDCSNSTEVLHILSVILAVFSACAIGFYTILLPFWIMNRIWPSVQTFKNIHEI